MRAKHYKIQVHKTNTTTKPRQHVTIIKNLQYFCLSDLLLSCTLYCFGEIESLQEIVDSSRISSCRRWGMRQAKKTCQNLDPDLPPWNAYKTDISVIARPTFDLPPSVTGLSSALDVPCICMCHIALFFSQKSTHMEHTAKTLTLLLDRKSCSDYDHWPCLCAFWLKLCWS